MRHLLHSCIWVLAAASTLSADLPPAELDAKLTEAREMAATGRKPEAFALLEEVIRNSVDQPHKFAAREEMLKMGPTAARPQNDGEKAQVASEILEERHRYYGDVMDQLAGNRQLRGVRLFRKRIMEDGGGGTDGQKNALRELEARIIRELLPKEDKDEVEKLKKSFPKSKWAEAGKDAEKRGKKHMALELYKDAFYGAGGAGDAKALEELRERMDALEKEVLELVSPEETKAFNDAVNHRVFSDLVTRESHHFIFIGDKGFVPRIPEQSMLELDVAYIFITDMIARQPDDDGQRITVFFKELWNFGGATGGGKTIRAGSINPKQKDITVSNFLYFHELCHCLFDTAMIWTGFVEGVANFGATMAQCSLGQKAAGEGSFKSNLEAFHRDFLGRDEDFFRIQNYGPSCGFWLHFVDKYGKGADGVWDWSMYRKWFRLWRAHPLPPGETVEKARVFGRCLSEVFGTAVWKDLKSFGWPVIEDDESLTKIEKDELADLWRDATNQWARGDVDETFLKCENLWMKYPEHHLAARARRLALEALDKSGGKGAEQIRKDLGLVMEWKCCGPFYSKVNGLFDIFGPEREIDYAKEYANPMAKATWFDPKIRFDGIVKFEFPYMDGIVCYGLVNVKVPGDTDAWLFAGSNDGWGAWVKGELIDKFDEWRGVMFDEDRVNIRLRAGWNRVLLKIRNGNGEMGFVGRITDRKGVAIAGMEMSHEPKETPMLTGRKPGKADPVWRDDFNAAGSERKYQVPCGGWKVTNKALWGTDDKRNMGWMKFLVTPGREKDAPAQCIWVKDTTLKGAKDLAIELKLVHVNDGRPKFGITLDGEGQNDGQSGTTIVFHPDGEGCRAILWRYDHVLYDVPGIVFPAAKEHTMTLVRFKERISVTFDGVKVFDDVSMPQVDKSNFLGFMTWDKGVGFDDVVVYKLGEK
ncbi:MAG: hypothetical protein AAB074_16820 [Planctomycetota bacterium]